MTDIPAIAAAAAPAATSGISTDTSRLASKANLEKAGQQFEAVFTGMMLKSMRAAKLADPLFDSKALDTFNDMSDQKLVQAMAQHTPLGIGKAMTDKAVGHGKVSAADVAQFVFDAIEADRFYIYSHPKALGSVQTRLEDVVQARNPTDPFAAKPEIGAELRAALRATD